MPRDLYLWFSGEAQLTRVNRQHQESEVEVRTYKRPRLMFTHFHRICSDADALLPEKSRWSKRRQHMSWLSKENKNSCLLSKQNFKENFQFLEFYVKCKTEQGHGPTTQKAMLQKISEAGHA